MANSIPTPAAIEHRSLDAFFTESALTYPTRPALFAAGRYWSYCQLDAECERIEQALYAVGVTGTGSNVGLIYGRDVLSYAAIIAIMRSDNVYVPLNPKLPAERLLRIIADAGVETVVIDASEGLSDGVVGALRQAGSLQIIVRASDPGSPLASVLKDTGHKAWCLTDSNIPIQHAPSNNLEITPRTLAHLAYIIYTSGSTGVPKGVPISHESACSCIQKAYKLFGTCEQDRFTQFSALSFDVSILDLFLCWKSGGTLYVATAAEALVPLNFVVKHEITVWSSVPSLANFLLKLGLLKPNALTSTRLFLFCGEALPAELACACQEAAPRSRVFNLYGPTECTIFATCHQYDKAGDTHHGTVPIGAPLPGMHYRIVDEGRVVETEGEPGELWLSGNQLSQGYWKNSAATRAAFVSAPSEELRECVWYRTGDLVSHHPATGLSFRGRLDRQVKLRGYRIELQEVESALRQVTGCTVVAVVPCRNSGGICEKLIAYCDVLSLEEASVKALCLSRMPQYMVPDRILRLDTFPLSDSGKINYLALSARATDSARPETTAGS